jgi:hypothetical protein
MQSLSHGMGGFMQEMARIPKSHALVFSPSKATTALTHENLQQAVPKLESYDSPGDMPTMGNVEQGGAFSSAVMRPDAENSMLVTELKGALEEHDAPPAAAVMDRLQMHEDAAPAIDPFQMQEHASQVMQQFQDNAQYAAAGVKRQRHATAAGSKAVDGRDVTVQLRNNGRMPHMGQTFEISLQEFLDTIDASSHYIAAKSPGYHQTAVPAQPLFSAVPRGGSEGEGRGFYSREEGGYPNKQSPDSIFSSTTSSDDLDSTEMSPVLSTVLDPFPSPHGVTSIWGEGGVWSQFSRGDQAYFFFRNAEHAPFSNGAVVALKGGQLVAADQALKAELYLVVSDKNALWKGEPHPTPEQEEEGHWCAFLGQVPLWVEGPVCAGQYLGPVGDGSGLAKVVRPGAQPAVAIALEDKAAGLTALKCMVSVGLNSLHVVSETGAAEQAEAASQRSQLLKRLDSASVSVQCVSAKAASAHKAAAEAKAAASAAAEAAHRAEVGVSQLTIQVHGLRESVRDNRQMLDDMHTQPISRRQYLWSCLCGLMSIKVTESWGPGIASQSFTVYTEEARPLSRMDEAKPLLPNPEASPAGPEEVEATCMGYQTSTSSSSCPISNLLSKLVCSTMKWSADAFVTDTTINLALTCILMRISHATGCFFYWAPVPCLSPL